MRGLWSRTWGSGSFWDISVILAKDTLPRLALMTSLNHDFVVYGQQLSWTRSHWTPLILGGFHYPPFTSYRWVK